MDTFATLVQRAIKVIGEVDGTSVQTYSQPRVEEALRQIFDLAFRKSWWDQYCFWYEVALDGTLGLISTDSLTSVKDFRDVKAIIPENQDRALPRLPYGVNPFNLTGSTVMYYEPLINSHPSFAGRMFQFWPKTAVGNLKIRARILPTLVDETIMYLDTNMLVNGAAWMILEDEDINPNAAQLRKTLFNEFFESIQKNEADQPIENINSSGDRRFLTEWQAP